MNFTFHFDPIDIDAMKFNVQTIIKVRINY